jgi:hypothetical protein
MKASNWQYLYKKNLFNVIPDYYIQKPQFFYKYYSISHYNIDAFLNSKFYFSHPLILNDLFDATIQAINLEKMPLSQLVNLYDSYSEIIWKDNIPDYHEINYLLKKNIERIKMLYFN